MPMELEADIRKAIDANLSNEIGTRLKERLEKAESDASSLKGTKNALELAERTIEERNAQIRKHKSLDEREAALTKREADVLAREVRQEVLAEKLNGANGRAQAVYDLAAMVFRNPRFVRTESVNEQVPVAYAPGAYQQTATQTSQKTVTEGQE